METVCKPSSLFGDRIILLRLKHILPDGSKERPIWSGIIRSNPPHPPRHPYRYFLVYVILSFPYTPWFPLPPVAQKENAPSRWSRYRGLAACFRLPAVNEEGGSMSVKLYILNSCWILLPAVEGEGLPGTTLMLGALQQGFCWGFNVFSGTACIASFGLILSLKTDEGVCSICVLFNCYNRTAFPVVSCIVF
jgi:hypothetical protein